MHPLVQKVAIFGLITLFIVSWSTFLLPHRTSSLPESQSLEKSDDNPIYNETLGFQKVFALALPGRKDRTRPLLDAANATNISITVMDAVRDKEIPKSSWPQSWGTNRQTQDVEKVSTGSSSFARTNVDNCLRIVAERISSALIMESDADWDMRIKDIMASLVPGVEAIADWPFTPINDTEQFEQFGPPMDPSPYGPNWDVLWMGHCGASNHGNGRLWAINDTSVPPEPNEYTFGSPPQDEQHRPGTRMVFQLTHMVCSTAYSITYAGAVKLVELFKDATENLDLQVAQYCRDAKDLTCLGVWPQVITAASSKSNIDHPDGETAPGAGEEIVEVHAGPGLQYSARINAAVAQKGLGKESWHPEWNWTFAMVHDEWQEISFEQLAELEEVQRWEKGNISANTNGTRG
ncbi:hypothetical protein ACLMJK_005777 [Lecanora helva]